MFSFKVFSFKMFSFKMFSFKMFSFNMFRCAAINDYQLKYIQLQKTFSYIRCFAATTAKVKSLKFLFLSKI